ncbi:hypothetical protein M427DRAFT_31017 [Gonapodya prolifera JEL478]|uniref:Uncharacterized protein n=1 Tax=Gonapodya prolifera (strain JEL478) TaxID=1344416 RepID=A0A139AJ57_GONPJ|nr:hypothetical protein M427DRAFT_31017 [Gonapodya prolifera JEL478]|eukprot:KXS16594.1 hypothetical protein M427DRAFT_31017 [Gonapodya prolifera JEL478]
MLSPALLASRALHTTGAPAPAFSHGAPHVAQARSRPPFPPTHDSDEEVDDRGWDGLGSSSGFHLADGSDEDLIFRTDLDPDTRYTFSALNSSHDVSRSTRVEGGGVSGPASRPAERAAVAPSSRPEIAGPQTQGVSEVALVEAMKKLASLSSQQKLGEAGAGETSAVVAKATEKDLLALFEKNVQEAEIYLALHERYRRALQQTSIKENEPPLPLTSSQESLGIFQQSGGPFLPSNTAVPPSAPPAQTPSYGPHPGVTATSSTFQSFIPSRVPTLHFGQAPAPGPIVRGSQLQHLDSEALDRLLERLSSRR